MAMESRILMLPHFSGTVLQVFSMIIVHQISMGINNVIAVLLRVYYKHLDLTLKKQLSLKQSTSDEP